MGVGPEVVCGGGELHKGEKSVASNERSKFAPTTGDKDVATTVSPLISKF